mmetsp:Transcript_9048/g.13112  ORF Transcript_9048/g.13112 Transcript_9048/m.13112 type:complete len:142 (+) Transcript_9048:3-428(+)
MAAQANQAQIDALNGQIADLVNLVNQLRDQVQNNAGPGQGQQPPPPQVPPAVFARDPAQVNQVNLLNYNDRKDTDIYKNGSAALPGDAFDGTNHWRAPHDQTVCRYDPRTSPPRCYRLSKCTGQECTKCHHPVQLSQRFHH